jgi:hypothetical protein
VTDPNTALDELAKSERPLGRRRLWARRFTITMFFGPTLLAVPNFASCLAHSRVDSEVGVMMHGLPLLIGVMWLGPVVGASTAIWGLGMRKARLRGEEIPFWERWCFRAIAAVLIFVLWGFSADPLYRAMSCVGL